MSEAKAATVNECIFPGAAHVSALLLHCPSRYREITQPREGRAIQRPQSLLITALAGTHSVSLDFQTREAKTEAWASSRCHRLNLKMSHT